MTPGPPKMVIIGLQQTFLAMVLDQVSNLFGGQVRVRTLALNELGTDPPRPGETLLYFSRGLRALVEKMVPKDCRFLYASRENLIYNMRELFGLPGQFRILVVNDVRTNTDEMTRELEAMGLDHEFVPYYPDRELPRDIDYVVTAGERMLVPQALEDKPIIDIGLRFISLDSVYDLFEHFGLAFSHAALARHYMRTMMMLSEKWPVLGRERFRHSSWFGTREDTRARFSLDDLVMRSRAMKAFYLDARKIAATGKPIHVYGRIGTGKTKVSQALHNASPFGSGPFVSVNCAARPMESLGKELFGWEDRDRVYKGVFEAAENGTLCIEEIGKVEEDLQARLLQALSESRIIRSGGTGHTQVRVRVITTSSQPLESLLANGFNPELALAMTQHICRIPTLSERMADFEDLVHNYLAQRLDKPGLAIAPETMAALKAHPWDGNVQELYNVLQHMACMSAQVLEKSHLPYYIDAAPLVRAEDKPDSGPDIGFSGLVQEIRRHGFLAESREILAIYRAGKEKNRALGRSAVQEILMEKGYDLTVQQLRLKLERMDSLGLLIVRPGRGGTTISEKGEAFLNFLTSA